MGSEDMEDHSDEAIQRKRRELELFGDLASDSEDDCVHFDCSDGVSRLADVVVFCFPCSEGHQDGRNSEGRKDLAKDLFGKCMSGLEDERVHVA